MGERCGIYPRQSLDRGGRGVNVGIQVAECRDFAEAQGWQAVVYDADNDISASRYATRSRRLKDRPDYRRLVADLQTGLLDVVLLTEVSRLDRDIESVPALLRIAEQHRFVVATTSGERYDLATAQGIYGFVDAVNQGMRESRLISDRTKRKKAARAREGAWWGGGPRPFGFQLETAQETRGGRLVTVYRLVVDAAEAGLVREAAERVLAGGTRGGIARSWRDRGVGRTGGRQRWESVDITQLLRAPRIAGLRRAPSGELVTAQWDPIITPATWEQVQAVLDAAAPVERGGRLRYLLTGIACCATCTDPHGAPLPLIGGRGQAPSYRCRSDRGGCAMQVFSDPIDEQVRDATLVALTSPALTAAVADAQAQRPDAAAAALAAERRKGKARLAQLRDDLADGIIEATDFAHAKERIEARIAVAQRQVAPVDPRLLALADLPDDGDELRRLWNDDWDLDQRRAVLGGALERVWIKRPGRGRRVRLTLESFSWRV